MNNLNIIIEYLHPGALEEGRVKLQDDGAGPYIALWNVPGVEPTEDMLQAAESEAILLNTRTMLGRHNAAVFTNKMTALPDPLTNRPIKGGRDAAFIRSARLNAHRRKPGRPQPEKDKIDAYNNQVNGLADAMSNIADDIEAGVITSMEEINSDPRW